MNSKVAFLTLLFFTLSQWRGYVSARRIDPNVPESFPAKNSDCPCIDSSTLLLASSNCEIEPSSHADEKRSAEFNDTGTMTKEPGILVDGICYPIQTYGSNVCSRHDILVDPACSLDLPLELRLPYCDEPWCFVDYEKCRDSTELFYRSNILGGSEYDSSKPLLYYSYSTCGGSADEWLDFATTLTLSRYNQPFRVAIPQISPSNHYKTDEMGNILEIDAPAYYNNSHPWVGLTIDYFNAVLNVSNIPGVLYTHRSVGSAGKGYESIWTQTVADVEAGIADFSVSSYWITSER